MFCQKKLRIKKLKKNLHRGCLDWNPEYYPDDDSDDWKFNIAANVQWICEEEIMKIMKLKFFQILTY